MIKTASAGSAVSLAHGNLPPSPTHALSHRHVNDLVQPRSGARLQRLSVQGLVILSMSSYSPGDVLLVPFPFPGGNGAKLRPALVIALGASDDPICCPLRSSRRPGTTSVPIGIDDFREGGLDLFSVSYVEAGTTRMIRKNAVAGKRGRVHPEFLVQVSSLARQ